MTSARARDPRAVDRAPAMDTRGRLSRLRALMADRDVPVDAVLVTSLTNIRYLTGFTGSAGLLVVLPDEAVLVSDGRYATQAAEQVTAAGVAARVEIAGAPEQAETTRRIVATSGIGALTLEAAHVSWARQRSFADEWFPGIELCPSVGLVEELRRVKDPGELARITEAARIADDALAAVRDQLTTGPTEIEFGRALDFEMRRLGASGPSFETIVAGGPNGAKPHHRPGTRPLRAGEPIVLDFGALFDGYCSDMTRTVWVGGVEEADLRRAVDVVAASQAAGVAAVRAGAAASAVDAACRAVIAEAGLADRFVHGTGHGVGLEIHEAPWVGSASGDTLEAGHVVTVEPGVYLPGIGGVRIEDTVVVTEDGCLPLTRTPKDRL